MIIRKIDAKKNNRKDGRSLLLFFSGWGMDEHPFMEYLPVDRDCMICYDYRSLAFDESLLAPYEHIRMVAWSMGVWAASHVLSDRHFHVAESIAINGTPWPVDDERGIATAIFYGTLEGLNEETLQKFRWRMCGSKGAFAHFMEYAPRRTVENLREELLQIAKFSSERFPPSAGNHLSSVRNDSSSGESRSSSFVWDKVYIGLYDKIFLPANQRKAWAGGNTVMVECEHYPSTLWNELFGKSV
jgi:malonyl-CoA O-methyltransferase/biotin synthesis protein BioG